MSSRASSQN